MSNETAVKELELYKKKNVNILGPKINPEELSVFHKIVFDSIRLSSDVVDGDVYKYKDAYKGRPAQYVISGAGLKKLSVMAGVYWNPAETRIVNISQRYVAYSAVGCVKRGDGTNVCYSAEADCDIDVEEDNIIESYKQKRKKWATVDWFIKMGEAGQFDYIESGIRKELNHKKKFKTRIAATDARSRVLRPLLMIKKTYTIEELGRDFVMPRVVLSPDYKDKTVQKMMLAAALQSQISVFGPAQPQVTDASVVDVPQGEYNVMPAEPGDIAEIDEQPETAPRTETDKQTETRKRTESEIKPGPGSRELFCDMTGLEQVETLIRLSERKGYEPKQPIAALSPKDSLTFWDALNKLQDVVDDDVPF